jgi:hypothetical protein
MAESGRVLLVASGVARRDVGPRVVAADDAEDLQFTGAGERQPQIRLVARPALRSDEGRLRRHQTAGAALVFATSASRHVVAPAVVASVDLD